jgi:hypothetical protein
MVALDRCATSWYHVAMAEIVYSSNYASGTSSRVWSSRNGLAGFFQIKEDQTGPEPFGSAVFSSPNLGYRSGTEYYWDGIVDYDTARHWPHP